MPSKLATPDTTRNQLLALVGQVPAGVLQLLVAFGVHFSKAQLDAIDNLTGIGIAAGGLLIVGDAAVRVGRSVGAARAPAASTALLSSSVGRVEHWETDDGADKPLDEVEPAGLPVEDVSVDEDLGAADEPPAD